MRIAAMVVAGLWLTACGQLQEQRSLRTTRSPQPSRVRYTGGPQTIVHARIAPPTAMFEVTNGQPCVDERVTMVRSTQVIERSVPGNWANFAVGIVLGAGALGAFIAAPSLSSETSVDPETGEETASEQTAAIALGVTAALVSAGYLYFGVSKASAATDEELPMPPTFEVARGPVRSCRAQPLAAVELALGAASGSRSLGRTGADGRLRLNLVEVAGRDLFVGRASSSYPILVRGERLGVVSTAAVRQWLHEESWRRIGASSGSDELETFTRDFPESPHVAAAVARAAGLREDEAWAETELRNDWQGYRAFAAQYPDSARVASARERMRDGLLASVLPDAERLLTSGEVERAADLLGVAATVAPEDERVVRLLAGIEVARAARAERDAMAAREVVARQVREALAQVGRARRERQLLSHVSGRTAAVRTAQANQQIAEGCERARAAMMASQGPPEGLEQLQSMLDRACQER